MHLPNGVEGKLIVPGALRVPHALCGKIAGLRRPVVGSYGVMDDRSGFDILRRVARLLPEFTFVMLGMIRDEQARGLADCRQLGNIVFPGSCGDAEAAGYLRAMDALAMFHPLSHPMVSAMCPNKLWTYLATSRPVVSTPIPEVLIHKDVVHPGDTPEQLAERLSWLQSVQFDDGLGDSRLQRAREHTWDRIAARLARLLGCLNSSEKELHRG